MPWWILENTLLAAILALIVVLASRSARLSPVIRHGLWLVVLIKLITPPLFSVELPIPHPWRESARVDHLRDPASLSADLPETPEYAQEPVDPDRPLELGPADPPPIPIDASSFADSSGVQDAPQVVELATTEDQDTDVEEETIGASGEMVLASDLPESAPPGGASSSEATEPHHFAARFAVWALVAGTCLMISIQVLRLVRLRRLFRRTVPAHDDFTLLVADLAARMRMRPPAVRLSHDVNSPIVFALGRAVMIWPAAGLPSLHGPAREGVVVHELAHLARRDHWIGWLELVAGCAWWWNPLFWYVRRQLHDNAELACDAWATALIPDGKRDYARALVDLAELDSLKTATVPALGVGDGSRQLFERRLVMILGERVRYRMGTLGVIGMGLLGLVALPGCDASLAGEQEANIVTEPPRDPSAASNAFDSLAPSAGTELTPLAEPPVEVRPPVTVPPAAAPVPPMTVKPGFPASETSPAISASNEDRLKRLEDKFEALMAELRSIHTGSATGNRTTTVLPRTGAPIVVHQSPVDANVTSGMPTTPQPSMSPNTLSMPNRAGNKRPPVVAPHPNSPVGATVTVGPKGKTIESQWPVPFKHYIANPDADTARSADGESVVLTRSTYKLPAGKADEVAAFLKSNLSDDVEVRVKDGALQVTATADDQASVAQFVKLLQTRGAPRAESIKKRPVLLDSAYEDETTVPAPANKPQTN